MACYRIAIVSDIERLRACLRIQEKSLLEKFRHRGMRVPSPPLPLVVKSSEYLCFDKPASYASPSCVSQ
jgi:hypothetical protein